MPAGQEGHVLRTYVKYSPPIYETHRTYKSFFNEKLVLYLKYATAAATDVYRVQTGQLIWSRYCMCIRLHMMIIMTRYIWNKNQY